MQALKNNVNSDLLDHIYSFLGLKFDSCLCSVIHENQHVNTIGTVFKKL